MEFEIPLNGILNSMISLAYFFRTVDWDSSIVLSSRVYLSTVVTGDKSIVLAYF